jgi:ligand-binding sensor domain-containing protein
MWIGGTYGTLLRWNGTTFSSVTLPSSASNADITSVWGTSTSDLWLGTGSGYNAVYHFDGNTWSELRLGARYTPNLIIGTASTDLWGFGPFDGQIIRYHP